MGMAVTTPSHHCMPNTTTLSPQHCTRAAHPLAALLVAIAMAGCASAPTPPPIEASLPSGTLSQWARADTPGVSGAPADDATLANWWSQFSDPLLNRLVQQALTDNRDLQSAQATVLRARAARAATQAGFYPTVGIDAGASRSTTRQTGVNTFHLGLSASWEPDVFGAQSAGLAAADADLQTAQWDEATTRMSLLAELGIAYVQWRGAQAREDITRQSLANFEQTLQLAQWKARAGLASALDVQQAQLSVEQTRATLPNLAAEIAQDEHQIALLVGQSPSGWRQAWPIAPGPVPEAASALQRLDVGVPSDLLRRRPDLRSAEAAIRGAWARKEQARRAGWPGLSLTGSVGLQAATLSGLSASTAGVAALAAAVDWTLFDAGARDALVDQQDALLQRTRIAYDAAVLSALKDVEDGLVALSTSRERTQSLSLAAEAAAQALLSQQQRLQAGLIDFATLLQAQRDELGARLSLRSAQTDVCLNLIVVYKALGGGWPAGEQATIASK